MDDRSASQPSHELVACARSAQLAPAAPPYGVVLCPEFLPLEPVRNRAVDKQSPPVAMEPSSACHGHCLEHLPSAANARALASSPCLSSPSLCFLYSSQKSRAARTLCVDRAKTSPLKPALGRGEHLLHILSLLTAIICSISQELVSSLVG
ncbi:hypothetical protein ZWY2020_025037 [Hordeum vulgare]|nr:hypothetical protein ZWY2020_025037 [Hordeum vulgare]